MSRRNPACPFPPRAGAVRTQLPHRLRLCLVLCQRGVDHQAALQAIAEIGLHLVGHARGHAEREEDFVPVAQAHGGEGGVHGLGRGILDAHIVGQEGRAELAAPGAGIRSTWVGGNAQYTSGYQIAYGK